MQAMNGHQEGHAWVKPLAARIERSLTSAVERSSAGAPGSLAAALRHAVFPGGARARPLFCLAAARACGDDHPELSDAAATAVELLHCASLVHDDLPCFDDAPLRRGKASVHRAFGQPAAVLAGDALIVLAFDVLARGGMSAPGRLPALLSATARGVGAPRGIVAGQAWELEADPDLSAYHAAKTGALFEAAFAAGALAAGGDAAPFQRVGAKLGLAYQIADDLADVTGDAGRLGKPAGRDAALGRPNAVAAMGAASAAVLARRFLDEAAEEIPACTGRAELGGWLRGWGARLGL